MLAVARAVTSGWWQGPVLAALCFQLPLLQWLSMAILALVTLRGGLQQAAITLMGMLVATFFATQAQGILPLVGVVAALVLVLSAQVLRELRRLEWAWVAAASLTVVGFLILIYGVPEVLQQYKTLMSQVLKVWVDSQPAADAAALREDLLQENAILEAFFVQLLAVSVMLSVGVGLTLGRYWQAALFNPGGFGEELRQFRLEPSLAIVLLGLWLLMQSGSLVVSGLSQVLWLPFLVGGIGCFHWFAAQRKLPVFSYVAFYILVLLIQIVVVVFALIDSFFDVRRRMVNS
jgi:hypothetical protein